MATAFKESLRPISPADEREILAVFGQMEATAANRWTTTRDHVFTTWTGRRVSLTDPQPEQIAIEDIAHALANICRFNGHVGRFWSVASHSVFVSRILPEHMAMAGLLHDSAEAYLGDLTSPVKALLLERCDVFKQAEARLMAAICERFGVNPLFLPAVKYADNIALATERRDIGGNGGPMPGDVDPHPLPIRGGALPSMSEREFLDRFNVLTGAGEAEKKPLGNFLPKGNSDEGKAVEQAAKPKRTPVPRSVSEMWSQPEDGLNAEHLARYLAIRKG